MNYRTKKYDSLADKVIAFAQRNESLVELSLTDALQLLRELRECNWSPNEKMRLEQCIRNDRPKDFFAKHNIFGVEVRVL